MRIGISLLNFRIGRIGGTETYLRELIRHLAMIEGNDTLLFVVDRDIARAVPEWSDRCAIIDYDAKSIERQRFLEAVTPWRARSVERQIESLQLDVMLFPQQAVFPKRIQCPVVLVAHDLYHVQYPHNLNWKQRLYRNAIYKRSIDRADSIIAISDFTRQAIIQHYGLHNRSQDIVRIYHGMEADSGELNTTLSRGADTHTADSYVYYPAASHPHKNHLQLLRTIAESRQRGAFPYRLILSGDRTPHWKVIERCIREWNLDDIVSHEGFVPYSRVVELYTDAAAIVFPSEYEGFGIPIIESFRYGRPVITSDIDVFRELGVPEANRIDFADSEAFVRAMQIAEPVQLKHFQQQWADTARETLEIMRRTANAGIVQNTRFVPSTASFEAYDDAHPRARAA